MDIPLRYQLYFGADKEHFDQIALARKETRALKIFMGCSTGGLVVETDGDLDKAFRCAKDAGLLVAVHAEDEALLKEAKKAMSGQQIPPCIQKCVQKKRPFELVKKPYNSVQSIRHHFTSST